MGVVLTREEWDTCSVARQKKGNGAVRPELPLKKKENHIQ